MNNKQFCFIICTNNEVYLEECLIYISNLIVPEGYTVNVLTIKGAHSMSAGYNEGMNASNAKYKIYLHQDVFILNRYFLLNILNIFNYDKRIGMIGMVGAPELSKEAIMWSVKRVGSLATSKVLSSTYKSEICENPEASTVVKAIDGFMMITSIDIPWRDDIFDGWDFYDMSQSMEFHRKKYLIVVPPQNNPWCMHDDGVLLSLLNYNHYRKLFIDEYSLVETIKLHRHACTMDCFEVVLL